MAPRIARATAIEGKGRVMRPAPTRTVPVLVPKGANTPKDHFVTREGLTYAGQHLIADFWGATRLDDEALMEETLRRAAHVAEATILHVHVHKFEGGGGVSGVIVLAESHISVHTWPERGFAAFDVFMCGSAKPLKAIEVLRQIFQPSFLNVAEHKRGIV